MERYWKMSIQWIPHHFLLMSSLLHHVPFWVTHTQQCHHVPFRVALHIVILWLWMTTRYTTPLPLYVCACICVCVWGLPCSPFSYMYTCTVGVKQCLHVYRFVCWQKIFKNASGKLARVCRGFIVDANNERTLLGMFMYTWYKSRQFFLLSFSAASYYRFIGSTPFETARDS